MSRCRGHEMYLSVSSDPSSSSTEYDDHAGINQASRDKRRVTLADVDGVVADLDNIIHLLRKEIRELRGFHTISVTCTSLVEKNGPLGSPEPDKESGQAVLKDTKFLPRGEVKVINKTMRFKDKNGRKNYTDNYKDGMGISSSTINTCNSENCFSDEISWNRQSDKRRRWNKSTHTGIEKSEECSRTKCHGRRVRKSISRGVQTLQKKENPHRVRRKVVDLFKFKWCSIKKCWENSQKCSAIASSETDPAEGKSVEVIYRPHENSGRNDNFSDRKSNEVTSDTNDKKTEERPVQTNGNDNAAKKNYNRKYDFSVDGTNIEIVRMGKSGTTEENTKLPKRFTDPPSRVDPEKNRGNIRRKARARSKRNVEKATVVNEGELSVPDDGSFSQIDERKGNKSETHETVKRKDNAADKTVRINKPEELKSTNNRALNSEDRGRPPATGKIDATEKPATKEGTKGRSKETQNPSTFKSLKSESSEKFHGEGRRNNVSRSAPIGKQLDARRNEIADVKKRLDACIADLNDIILNLSKVSQGIPAPGSGPAGERTSPDNLNRSRRGRSCVRS